MNRLAPLLVLAFAPTAIHAAPPPRLTTEGYGPIRIGMTREQAERAIGHHILINDNASGDAWACANGSIAPQPEVTFLLEHLRIRVISIEGRLTTVHGVRVGTSERELRRIFGRRAIFRALPYGGEPGDHEVVVKAGGKREFLFETKSGNVTGISVGDLPAVEYWEGCV